MSDTKAKLMELTKSVLADRILEVSAGNASLREGLDVMAEKFEKVKSEEEEMEDVFVKSSEEMRGELERLKAELEKKLTPGEPSPLLGEKEIVDLLRPFANTDTLQRVNMMKMRDNEGIDVGVRVGALQKACAFVEKFDLDHRE